MSVETFDPANSISVTPAAAQHFENQLKQSGCKAVRISLKASGCSGLSYVFDGVDSPKQDDLEIKLENGTVFYVEAQALPALQGTKIDYTNEGLNQILKVDNPNVKGECGCGESFTL